MATLASFFKENDHLKGENCDSQCSALTKGHVHTSGHMPIHKNE